jgi:hypothetical protein
MEGWNPFGKVDMEIGSFLKLSPFNKQYGRSEKNKKIEKNDEGKSEKK